MDGIFDTSDTSGGEDDFSEQYYDNDYDMIMMNFTLHTD